MSNENEKQVMLEGLLLQESMLRTQSQSIYLLNPSVVLGDFQLVVNGL